MAVSLGTHARNLARMLAVIVCCFSALKAQAQQTGDDPGFEQQWFDAALTGDFEGMIMALNAGVNVNQTDASGATALLTAALSGDTEVVRFLLERGADSDRRAETGATPLMVAAWQGHLDTVRLLLGAGSDANATTSSNGATALIFAAQEGHLEVAASLLAAGAEIDAQADNGTSALMAATKDGHIETVRVLLGAGADISLQKRNGASALTIAASNGQERISDLLIYFASNNELPPPPKSAPPDPAVLGASLIASARIGDDVGVSSLLERKAPINHRNDGNETALIVAAEGGHLSTLRLLLNASPDLEAARKKDGATALTIAAGAGHAEVVLSLLEAGSNVDAPLGNTRYTEYAASPSGDTSTQALPKTRIRRAAQETPLMMAVLSGHNDVTDLLLEYGADPDRGNSFGETPLMAAARHSSVSTVEALLAAGAGPDGRNERGETALSIAVKEMDWSLASMLLVNGADSSALSDELFAALQASQTTENAAPPQAAMTEPAGDTQLVTSTDAAIGSTDVALRSAPEIDAIRKNPETGEQQETIAATSGTVDSDQTAGPDQVPTETRFDSDDRETIRQMQAMLNEAGFDAGPADGLIGRRTRNAIREYEGEIGLEATGEVSEKVFQRLQMETNG